MKQAQYLSTHSPTATQYTYKKETLSESQITLLIETLFESPKNIINKMQFDIGRYFQLEK